MGMARFLREKYDEHWKKLQSSAKVAQIAFAGADLGGRLFEILNSAQGIEIAHVVSSSMQHRFKFFASGKMDRPNAKNDSMTRVPASLYIGLEQRYGNEFSPERRTVSVPKYFLPRLEAWNKAREEADQHEVAVRARCKTLTTKVYKSRIFPPSLRAIIFERDGHRCCKCGRGREQLFPLGLHLEVDHKIAWIDGGETSYQNGETLCNECNSAKHHTKNVAQVLSLMRIANG